MSADTLSAVARLSNRELLAQVQLLAKQEREATAALIAHLAVLDERRLYLVEGCSSLFTYGTQVLHFSESAAYRRIEAARAARRYPVILEMLSDGSVNLTTIRLLVPEFTPANHRELLEAAKHKSKRQVEELIARLHPRPSVPSTIRRLPGSSHAAESDAGTLAMGPATAAGCQSAGDAGRLSIGNLEPNSHGSGNTLPLVPATPPAAPPPPARLAIVAPIAPERYKFTFTASAETYAKLRLARDLLRHQIPDGDAGEIFDRALTALLKDAAKQKFAATDRPIENGGCKSHGTISRSRHIPAEVKRAVWLRDGGRCAFTAHNGRRCTERAFLEFHHVVPYSAGGAATADNIQLRCRAHNGYEAELYFGDHMPHAREKPVPYLQDLERRTLRSPLRMTLTTRCGPSGGPDSEPP